LSLGVSRTPAARGEQIGGHPDRNVLAAKMY
jgi:hypothetical protein